MIDVISKVVVSKRLMAVPGIPSKEGIATAKQSLATSCSSWGFRWRAD